MQAFEPRLPPLTTGPDGVIRGAGTRVSLESVVYASDAGSSAEEIVEQYPTLSLSNVSGVSFDEALREAKTFDLDGHAVPYIGKPALIANKKSAGRYRT